MRRLTNCQLLAGSESIQLCHAHRLFDLLQLLRSYRYPVTAQTFAEQLGISVRSLYRDIASLQQQGADISGEPGLGYVLKPVLCCRL